jgi:phage replication O-like protein O
MASPQVENGHVRIANEIVEQLARVNLSKYEWRELWAVLRKTWGWRKKSDSVPLTQIAEMTGLRQPHVSRAKASLLSKHILFEEDGKIGFQKNYELWTVKGFVHTNSGIRSHTDSGIKTAESHTNSGRSHTNSGINPIPELGDSKEKKATNKSNTTQSDTVRHSPNPLSKDIVAFDNFWQLYPRKVGKGAAKKVWAKLKPDDALVQRILEAVSEQRDSVQWARDGGQYIPHPATWLSQERWDDELELLYHDPTPEEADAFFARRKAENDSVVKARTKLA